LREAGQAPAGRKTLMTIKKRIAARLKDKKGETLMELLFAMLISSLGMIILAGMIVASTNIIKRGNEVLKSYVTEENKIVAQDTEDETGSAIFKIGGTARKLTDYNDSDTDYDDSDTDYDDSDTNQVSVSYYVNGKIGGKKVVTYK
jgi:competence protein ComGC